MKSRLLTGFALLLLLGCTAEPSNELQQLSAVRQPHRAAQLAPRTIQRASAEVPREVEEVTQATIPSATPNVAQVHAAAPEPEITLDHAPLVTQQVVAFEGKRLVVDQIIDDGIAEPLQLRLRIDAHGDNDARIASVALVEDGVQLPYGSEAYQKMMAVFGASSQEVHEELTLAFELAASLEEEDSPTRLALNADEDYDDWENTPPGDESEAEAEYEAWSEPVAVAVNSAADYEAWEAEALISAVDEQELAGAISSPKPDLVAIWEDEFEDLE